jgi:hypothetical protein
MNTQILWQSALDSSITVESSAQALQLAQENPTDPRFRTWIQILKVI